jgi:hypothetical protein
MIKRRALKVSGWAAITAALALAFAGYLRPGFMVDLTNTVLAWCG